MFVDDWEPNYGAQCLVTPTSTASVVVNILMASKSYTSLGSHEHNRPVQDRLRVVARGYLFLSSTRIGNILRPRMWAQRGLAAPIGEYARRAPSHLRLESKSDSLS
jgi:hypothetical protein